MGVPLHVLTYFQDGEWIAHVLEMDLIGSGKTIDQAESELAEAIDAQMTFCIQHDVDPFRPAPEKYFKKWDELQKGFSRSMVSSNVQSLNEMVSYIDCDQSKYQGGKFAMA